MKVKVLDRFKRYLIDDIKKDNWLAKNEKSQRIKDIRESQTFEDALASYLGEEYIHDNVERDILIDFIETFTETIVKEIKKKFIKEVNYEERN